MIAVLARITGLRLVSLALAALFVVLLPAVMAPADYGRFTLALSIAQTLAAVLLSWPNQALLRFGREEFAREGRLGAVVATRLVLHLALLLPALVLAAAAAPALAAAAGLDAGLLRAALLLGLPLLSLSDCGVFAAQAAGAFGGYGWAPLALRLGQLAGLGAMATGLGGGWPTLMAATLAGYGLGAMLAWVSIPRGALAGLRPSWPLARRMMRYGRFQPLAILAAFLINWMDLWFLRWLADEAAVGIYAWAYTVTLVAMTLLVPVSAVLAPRAVDHCLDGDHAALRRVMAAVGSACVLLTGLMPAGLGMVALLLEAAPLGAYGPAVLPVLLLLAGTVYQLGSATVEPLVYAHESAAPAMAGVAVAMAAVNALADGLLIPLVGLAGPALATAAAYAAGMVLSWRMAGRLAGGAPSPLPFAAFGLVGLGAAAAAWALPPLVAAVCGVAVTPVLLLAARRLGLLRGLGPVLQRRWAAWLAGAEAA